MAMLSYVPKQNKAVVILSSMHCTKEIDEASGKPEIIFFCSKTKGGIDNLDNKCAKFSCSRKTCHWPLTIFVRLIDVCGANAHFLYETPTSRKGPSDCHLTPKRPEAAATISDRLDDAPSSLERPSETQVLDEVRERKPCKFCNRKLRRKTIYKCEKCEKFACLQSFKKVCVQCCGE
ncbi:hypothetical protein AVEN_90412-1 [Araneus ventricosus]|uniref:PiggyBac transposable element-derived protein domain-containing protein n=1 Tax=Araneus ventricosus TaxID=182803 RepID=A0A4Y2GH33_ARAVE|nr:hypothetical protein AVEN_90412-1 [Araneus ventricosus]